MDGKLQKRLQRELRVVDDHAIAGPRLVDDAGRLWKRLQKFISLNLIPSAAIDADALELACYALQLPLRQAKPTSIGKLGRTNLKERTEQAAEMLVNLLGNEIDEALLDRAARLLHETPHRSPMLDEAKLLADAINLDDFGLTGLILQSIQLTRHGDGMAQLAEGIEKREQYGYWDARLKDGFHFEPIRHLAATRLENSRLAAKMLLDELAADAPNSGS